ncbi:MAG: hypothetical protein H6735_25210 [Alphaproteobacteria bacterium]|nr:hypothetical protein [Alphaproteobacteria bacterium]
MQGSSEVRGAPTGEVPTVREGGSVVLRLRPASRTDLRAEVTVLADETPLPATVAWTDSGAAEVRVASVPAGTHELHVRLSAPGADPVELVQPIRMVP